MLWSSVSCHDLFMRRVFAASHLFSGRLKLLASFSSEFALI